MGTAIGTKCATSYACIFMSEFETSFIESQQNKPLVWFRYIDDIVSVLIHREGKFKTLLEQLNSFDSSLKFTHESSKEILPFLDLKFKLSKGRISTDLCVKDTDRHQHLHYTSSHPNHFQRSIVCSQAVRVKRICSGDKDFEQHIHEMRSWFQKRAYPNKVLDEELVKVRFSHKGKTCNK